MHGEKTEKRRFLGGSLQIPQGQSATNLLIEQRDAPHSSPGPCKHASDGRTGVPAFWNQPRMFDPTDTDPADDRDAEKAMVSLRQVLYMLRPSTGAHRHDATTFRLHLERRTTCLLSIRRTLTTSDGSTALPLSMRPGKSGFITSTALPKASKREAPFC